jgi:hypothetical protein
MAVFKKNEIFALPSIAVAAVCVSVFSVSVFECMFTEEKETVHPFFWGFHGRGTKGLSLFKP